jgi:hypothetical protein
MSSSTLTLGAYRASEYALITNPRVKTPAARYGAIWAHPAGGNTFQTQTEPYSDIIEGLAAAGYPVHAADYCAAAYQQPTRLCYNYGNSAYATAGAPSQTILNASSPAAYGAAPFAGIPMLLLSSDNDPVAMTTAQQQAWAAGYPNITVQSMGSVGHTVPTGTLPSGLTVAQTILQFFDACGGRS